MGLDNFIRKSKESMLSLLKTARKIKVSGVAEITLEHIESSSDEMELFLHSLDVVNKFALKKNINIKFIFDEFQDIVRLSDKQILEQFRSVAQHHEHVTYVFLGSIESIMTSIFEDKKSPFFHFARVMPLGGLDIAELSDYVFREFDSRKLAYDSEAINQVLVFLQGHPDYSMQVLQSIYFRALLNQEDINFLMCIGVLKEVILENKAYLEELIQSTKSKKHLYKLLSSIANDKQTDIPSKTLYNSHIALENMGLIRNIGRGKYELVDVFLNVLLQQSNEGMLIDSNTLILEFFENQNE